MDISNPFIINFLVENYEKESRLRLNWIQKNRDKVHEAATLKRKPTNYFESDVHRYNMKEGLTALAKGHSVSQRNRRKVAIRDGTFIPGIEHLRRTHSIPDVGLGDPSNDSRLARPDTDLSIDPIMRPVDPKLNEIIYKPKPEYGRLVYLKQRSKIWPEEKFYLTQSANWEYGWRMCDSKSKQVRFGRRWELTRGQKSRVGPQPDPGHYQSSEIPGPSKCL